MVTVGISLYFYDKKGQKAQTDPLDDSLILIQKRYFFAFVRDKDWRGKRMEVFGEEKYLASEGDDKRKF